MRLLTPHSHQWTDLQNKKTSKDAQVLNNTLDEMYLIDIFRSFHSNEEK